jgi:hypothetical protein
MKTLRMSFTNEDGKKTTLSVNYAKEGLTSAEVQTAMTAVLALPVFTPGLVASAGADLVDRTVTEIVAG